MRAKIVDDLLSVIEAEMPDEGHRGDEVFEALCKRIQGKEVELRFIGDDAFEAIDNNYWLPRCCFTPIEPK